MSEEFLHHIWKYRLFNQIDLTTVTGETVEVINVGQHNSDAGPDFFNSKIKIGKTLWAGNVEVHINASDWIKHEHQHDFAYNNIILHVVFNSDKKVVRKTGEEIPTIELKERVDGKLFQKYLNFKTSKTKIPCEKQFIKVPQLIINSTIDKVLIERLEKKSTAILNSLKLNKNNWEETFYQQLAYNFGFKINSEPFQLLAKSLPLMVLGKHKNNLLQIEALLFGQAEMLNEHFNDDYPNQLQNEYTFLKHKFKLNSIDKHLWKFLRLRPANFPTIRIAQFSNLIFKSNHLFSRIIETESYNHLKNLLDVKVSEYWQNHFVFDKMSKPFLLEQKNKNSEKKLGIESNNNIVINTVIPFLFVYGKQKGEEKYIDRALTFLEQIKGENNSIIRNWKELKMPVNTAYSTQAVLQLNNEYCKHKKCLQCSIGNYLLKNQ